MSKEELEQLLESISLVEDFFEDRDKALLWMTIENPQLGESKPIDFFWRGRGHKVLSFIKNSLDENEPG